MDRDFNNDYVIQAQTDFWFKRVIANQTDFTGFPMIVPESAASQSNIADLVN